MLPERVTELLSAYVDGELSSRERKNVTRILRKSGEARQMLHKLKQDSMILRKMPRRKTQMDLSGSVMGTISLRGITLPKIEAIPIASPVHPPPPKKRWPGWLALALAGLLLVAIGAASYYISVAAIRKNQADNRPGDSNHAPSTDQGKRSPAIPDKPLPLIGVMHEPETPEQARPGVDPKKDDRYGLGWTKPPAFVVPQPRLMLIQSVRDLDEPSVGQSLLNELRRDEATRIDLFCTGDTTPALDRLQAACKLFGTNLRLDAYAQARVKQKMRTNYAIYSRDLTPQEWTLLLQHLAGEDKRSPIKLFDKLAINGLTTAELAKVLGGEPTQYERPSTVDLTQDIASPTGTELAKSLSGQNPKPDPDNAALTRQAVAIPYLPQPGFSREVRYIVEGKSWRPGAVQVLLVLWNP